MQGRTLAIEPGSPSWPAELDHVEPRPARLWLRGTWELLARRPRVAVVGTRSPSAYGLGQAERFASAFAAAGACVVSGLARGVDQAAHGAALAAGGATIGVLGCGVDRPWPGGPTTDAMLARGLLLSEFPPGQGPRPHHFPQRNRLIAGLSRAVLVVEAAWVSGSLITARWAADQGIEVFALPGRVDHPMSRGTHRLLREGARLVEEPAEILAELGLSAGASADGGAAGADGGATAAPEDAALLAALTGETRTADELALALERPVGEVLTRLVGLELDGAVARGPGGLYRRTRGS